MTHVHMYEESFVKLLSGRSPAENVFVPASQIPIIVMQIATTTAAISKSG